MHPRLTVAQRLPNGNLLVRGQKWIAINQGKEYVRIQGIVRPIDIDPDNSISSLKVADAVSVEMDRTYKTVFAPRPGKPALILDSILRHREVVEKGRASLGFQFVGLETSTEGLRTLDRLARLVSHFQRFANRRVPPTAEGRPIH